MYIRIGILLELVLLSSCSSTPKYEYKPKIYPIISEVDAFKYEKLLLSKYEKLLANRNKIKLLTKWVQPLNKKIPCKVILKYKNNFDPTLNENYKIYWDGGCNDGYANGLGREFIRDDFLDFNELNFYQGKKEEPQTFLTEYNMDNIVIKELPGGYQIESEVVNNNSIFNIFTTYRHIDPVTLIELYVVRNLINKNRVIHSKRYPNFIYTIMDDGIKKEFGVLDPDLNNIGYTVHKYKDRSDVHAEMIGDKNYVKRQVTLPSSYTNKLSLIYSEIKAVESKALKSEKAVNRVIQRYRNRICNDNVSVNFIGNNEYKKICTNSSYNIALKERIKEEISKKNQIKANKLDDIYRRDLMSLKIRQARAAERAAMAAEQAKSNQNSEMQNLKNKMQNLNNDLFMMRMGL